jgi:nucleoside-diphosphate-sugar epimerase
MKVLYIGGTGEISYACLHAGRALGHEVVLFNRGTSTEPLPPGVRQIKGDLKDDVAYRALGREHFDAVCQFKAYTPAEAERDIAVFSGHCGQYVFISTASAYQKPPQNWIITEQTPLVNPYWAYSRLKAEMETVLLRAHAAGRLPVTIIRPSHTYRRNFPVALGGGDLGAWRMSRGKPVIIHGDGTSLWVVTHAEDFAYPFVRLLGRKEALGEAYHITHDRAWTWNLIVQAVGTALGMEPKIVHISSARLIQYNPDWTGPLLGDKAQSVWFDNAKVRRLVPDWQCRIAMPDGMRKVAEHYRKRAAAFKPDPQLDALLDRIVAAETTKPA